MTTRFWPNTSSSLSVQQHPPALLTGLPTQVPVAVCCGLLVVTASQLAQISHQLLLRRRKVVCELRYVSAREPQGFGNASPVANLTCLAVHQIALFREKTGEVFGLANGNGMERFSH